MLVALIVLPLVAFGGADLQVAVPLCAAVLLTGAFLRPQIRGEPSRTLDTALIAVIAVVAFQLVPLPAAVLDLLSPRANEVTAAIALTPPTGTMRPVSVSPTSTAWASLVAASAVVVFWIARGVFEATGVRRVTRAIATTGFIVSLVAIAQAATAGRDIYWIFPTEHEGPLPFGPFVNRNHFATWAVMAAPLCFGYIAARSDTHASSRPFTSSRIRIVRLLDGRAVWLFACGAVILGALLFSLSRSGILALAVSAIVAITLTRHRPDAARYWWFVLGGSAAVFAAALWADVGAIADRIAAAGTAVDGRVRIWRETLPIVRDFWVTGTGAGTYQRAMLLYQQSDRLWYFNQAHNHYLQMAAEGGALLTGAVAVAIAAYAREAWRRVSEDRSAMFWIRVSALCGLTAAALQSFWETGLTMPANAVLAAVLAAIAVHHRQSDRRAG